MKPHPRIRKTIKYGGAALTVLLVVVWIGSGWWTASWSPFADLTVWCSKGHVVAYTYDDRHFAPETPFWFTSRATALTIPRWIVMQAGSCRRVYVPLWIPVLPTVILTALAFCLDTLARRRERIGYCPKCHYDRAGIASDAVCPECGAAARAGRAWKDASRRGAEERGEEVGH